MKKPLKILLIFISIIFAAYIAFSTWFYLNQEKLMFFPEKLEIDHKYTFTGDSEEIEIKTSDGITLNSILFKAKNTSGLIFYLSGQGGSLEISGQYAKQFTDLNYDVFMLDYRGYGKSGGEIANEKQFYEDVQLAYDHVKGMYHEDKIIIYGISLGSAPATWLASQNKPNKIIILAPFYSILDLRNNFPPMKFLKIIPPFLFKYKFKNFENIEKLTMPLTVMHGDQDDFVYYGSSLKLRDHFKPGDTLITIKGGTHYIFHENDQVFEEQKIILNPFHSE